MSSSTLDTVLRALKRGEVAPAYYLYGPEDLLKDEVIRAVLDHALDPGLRDFNLDQRSATQLDPEDLYALCRTPPLMADRRVVVLRDVEAWKRKTRARSAAVEYLAKPSTDLVLVLVQGAGEDKEDKDLARLALAVACDPLTPERAARWVLHRAKGLGVTVEPEAAEHLVRVAGTDLGLLASELAKLASAADGTPVTADRVAVLVGVRHGETIFDWRDALFDGDPARAAGLLGPVLGQAGITGVRLLSLVGTTLVGLGAVRAAYDRNVRGARLEDAGFQIQRRVRLFGLLSWGEEARRWARWAPGWAPARIRAALRVAVAADVALKSTTISDERGVLLDLVLRLSLSTADAA
jgi:DNA polymerase III subunit delta